MSSSKVYVVQNTQGKNIFPATKFGEIVILLPEGQVTFAIAPTTYALTKGLANYSGNDYLLLIGDPIAIGLATAIAVKNTGGSVRFLKWDRQSQDYIPLSIIL